MGAAWPGPATQLGQAVLIYADDDDIVGRRAFHILLVGVVDEQIDPLQPVAVDQPQGDYQQGQGEREVARQVIARPVGLAGSSRGLAEHGRH